MRDLAADLARDLAHQRGAVDVVLRRAVREVEPHDVDAGADHALEHLGRRSTRGRAWRRSWWRGAWRLRIGSSIEQSFALRSCARSRRTRPIGSCEPAARARSRISNAGRVLPSSTSRNAPPPVEM